MHDMLLIPVLREMYNHPTSPAELATRCSLPEERAAEALVYAKEQGWAEQKAEAYTLTEKGQKHLEKYQVSNAIILAAGFGSRCVPLTYETPKGLLPVRGTPMLEREIEQLKEKGIDDIILVVGYMKEAFDYLVDKYGVKLIYNPDYATKNNFASLYRAIDYLDNSYVLVADNWIENNMFNRYEADSWFSCLYFSGETHEWCVASDADGRITRIDIGGRDSLAVVGPAYFSRSFSEKFKKLLREYMQMPGSDDFYWEHILRDHIADLPMYVNDQTGNMHEFESLEELRAYDKSYINHTQNSIMQRIAALHNVPEGSITQIIPIKAGVTNHSFKYEIDGLGYVFRLPGYGTEKLINRAHEKATYDALRGLHLTDDIIYFDQDSGVKITKYYAGSVISDPFNDDDLKLSMTRLKPVHDMKLKVEHSYDIATMIDYYYSLAAEIGAIRFRDVHETLKKVEQLIGLKNQLDVPEVLCHGDYAHTNVLKLANGDSRLIDWEYSGMADPMMDVSMYCLYAQFDKQRIDLAAAYYLGRKPNKEEEIRLYLYVALGGFLWSMWGQYKQGLGQEFGEYPLKMYRYMKDYYRIVQDLLAQQ